MRIIAGEARGRKLHTVRRHSTRPTMDRVRESLFAILAPRIQDARFLDLFAGTGSVGLEALSRGAAQAVFVDSSRSCVGAIRENLRLMDCAQAGVILSRPWGPALKSLAAQGQVFDLIFADPPYQEEKVLFPLAERLEPLGLLAAGGRLILQHSVRLALPDRLGSSLQRVDSRKFGETVLTFYAPDGAADGAAEPEHLDALEPGPACCH